MKPVAFATFDEVAKATEVLSRLWPPAPPPDKILEIMGSFSADCNLLFLFLRLAGLPEK